MRLPRAIVVGLGLLALVAAYGVTRLPARFLIDPEGRLIARNAEFRTVLGELDP